MRTAFCLLLISLGCLTGQESSPAKPTLVIKPLDGDLSQIQGWQPALGEGLAEMIVTELAKLEKFELLESTALADLIREVELGEAGYVESSEKTPKGNFKGADFMLVGKVTRFGANARGVDLSGFVPRNVGALGVQQSRNDVRIDWRLVDIATRKVLKTGSAVGQHNGVGFNLGANIQGSGGTIGYHNKDFMNSALGKATVKAVTNIVEQVAAVELPKSGRREAQANLKQAAAAAQQAELKAARSAPGKVLAVPGPNVVIVSVGSAHGFQKGDKVKLFEPVNTLDDQGNVVFTEEKEVGELVLDAVQEDRSKATYSGSAAVKNGWIVRGF